MQKDTLQLSSTIASQESDCNQDLCELEQVSNFFNLQFSVLILFIRSVKFFRLKACSQYDVNKG